MDAVSLLKAAAARRATAEAILDRLGLIERWSAVGRVEVVGSVALDVVVRPDIDLEVYTDNLDPRAGFAAVVPLADMPGVRRIRYLDARDWEMSGLYWKVEYETYDEKWTIDNWIFSSVQPGTAADGTPLVRAVIAADVDARVAVLAIKQTAIDRGERARGRWVYEAVLDHGVRTYPDYQAWLGGRDVWARSAWTPTGPRTPSRVD